MLKILTALVIFILFGAGFAWLADHSAALALSLPGWRISFSPLAAVILLLALLIAALVIIYILRLALSPLGWRSAWRRHKKAAAYQELSQSLMAAFAGDAQAAAAKSANAAAALPPMQEPLTALSISAAAEAQMREQPFFAPAEAPAKTMLPSGAQTAAKTMRALLQDAFGAQAAETAGQKPAKAAKLSREARLMALKTLFDLAQAERNFSAAQHYASVAAAEAPELLWAALPAAGAQAQAGEWQNALDIYTNFANARRKQAKQDETGQIQRVLDYYRQVLLCGQAAALFALQPRPARDAALAAHKINPLFAPACVVAAEILFQLDEERKAEKLLNTAWRQAPHPDLARAYAVMGGREKSAARQFERLQELAKNAPADSAVANRLLAQAAFALNNDELARYHAERAAKQQATAQDFTLLAELAARRGDAAAADSWLAQALGAPNAPCWQADGQILAMWQPLSPLTHELGACRYESPQGAAFTPEQAAAFKQQLEEALTAARSNNAAGQAATESAAAPMRAATAQIAAPLHGFAPSAPSFAGDDNNAAAPAPTYRNVDNPGVADAEKK